MSATSLTDLDDRTRNGFITAANEYLRSEGLSNESTERIEGLAFDIYEVAIEEYPTDCPYDMARAAMRVLALRIGTGNLSSYLDCIRE